VWEELGGRGGECHGLPMHLAPPRPKARAAVLRKGAQQVEAGISRGSLCACHFILTDFMLTGTHTFCHALAVTPFHGPSTHPHLWLPHNQRHQQLCRRPSWACSYTQWWTCPRTCLWCHRWG